MRVFNARFTASLIRAYPKISLGSPRPEEFLADLSGAVDSAVFQARHSRADASVRRPGNEVTIKT